MLKNPNQTVIRRMARSLLKRNQRRTVTLFLAVFLSAFMVFSIFTVGATYLKMQRIQNIRLNGADFDAIMYGLTKQQQKLCENNPDIVVTGIMGVCGWVEETDRDHTPNVGLIWVDDAYWSKMMKPAREELEGKYPVLKNEIMVTRSALKECGYENLQAGDALTVTYGTYGDTVKETFRISGIWNGYGPQKQFFMSKKFYEQSGRKLSQVSSGRYFIDFRQKLMTRKQQNDFIESMHLGKQQNIFFVEDLGASARLLAGITGLAAVTCLCAYLLICNIMYLSVAGKVRYFGLLQTVGMTERQIRKLLREQLFIVGVTGIAGGCLAGAGVSFWLMPVAVKALGIQNKYVKGIGISFHPVVLAVAVLLVGVTIWLAGRKPAKTAAAISPIEALGYRPVPKMGHIKKHRGRRKQKIISRLSREQFMKDKKRTIMVLVSLAASLSVYLCVVTLLGSQAARSVVSGNMDTDLVIQNDTAFKKKAEDRKDIIRDGLQKNIRRNDGVEEMNPLVFAEITVPWEPEFMDKWMEEFYAKWMTEPYKKERKKYQQHPEKFSSSLIGIDEKQFDRLNQNLKTPVNKKDFLQGKTCIIYRDGLELSDQELTGQKVACVTCRKEQKSFVIAGVTDDSYYSVLQGYPPTIITGRQVVAKLAPDALTCKLSIKYRKEYDRNTERELLSMLRKDQNAKDFSWESKLEEADEMEKAQGNMPQIGMGIVLILAFIGIMNYTNTFVVNVQSRMTELSVMESIGMTDRQLTGMLVREGALYAGGAWGLTLTAGLGIVYLICQTMNYRGVSFLVPVVPLLLAVMASVVLCVTIPVMAWKVLGRQKTVVERLKGEE